MDSLVSSQRMLAGFILMLLLALSAGSSFTPTSAQPAGAVITFVEDESFSQLGLIENQYPWSSYGPGFAAGDYDGDGDLDLFMSASYSHITIAMAQLDLTDESGDYMTSDLGNDTLLRNDGDTDGDGFVEFTDVTLAANIIRGNSTSLAGSWGDYDDHGNLDLYVSQFGHSVGAYEAGAPNKLYHNNGDGTFEEVSTLSGVTNPCHSSGAQWVDYDHDGDLDLYSLNYGMYLYDKDTAAHETNIMFRNDGDLDGDGHIDFTDATRSTGLAGSDIAAPGNGTCASSGLLRVDLPSGGASSPVSIGVHTNGSGASWSATWFDHNGDGWQDLFIASDFGVSPLYLNNQDGTFSAITNESDMMLEGTGMGTDVGDLDGDGDFDLCQTNIGPNYIWERRSGDTYDEASSRFDIGGSSSALNVNWVCQFFDYDLDGDLDLFFTVGQITPYTMVTANDNLLFRNEGGGVFTDVAGPSGLLASADGATNEKTQGASIVDIDNDGDLDIIVGNSASPPRIYYNQATDQTDNNWLKVDLEAEKGGPVTGTLVEVTAGGQVFKRQHTGCAGSFGCDATSVHFGLGSNEIIDEVKVTWPSGEVTILQKLNADQELTITEGMQDNSYITMLLLILLLAAGLGGFVWYTMKQSTS